MAEWGYISFAELTLPPICYWPKTNIINGPVFGGKVITLSSLEENIAQMMIVSKYPYTPVGTSYDTASFCEGKTE